MEFASVEEVEDLHHHKHVEDNGEVTRVVVSFLEGRSVVLLAVDEVEPTTADVAADNAVLPLELGVLIVGVLRVGHEVVAVHVLGYELLPHKHHHHHHHQLEYRLPYYMFQHDPIDDVVVPVVGFALEQLGVGLLCGQCQRREGVHYQINPEHLDGLQHLLLDQRCPHQSYHHRHYVHRQLELYEFADRVVDVSAPQHCLHDGVEVVVHQNYGCRFSRHLRPAYAHREAHVGFPQGRRIVRPVPCHCDHVASLSQRSHQAILVLGPGTGQNQEFVFDFVELLPFSYRVYSHLLFLLFSLFGVSWAVASCGFALGAHYSSDQASELRSLHSYSFAIDSENADLLGNRSSSNEVVSCNHSHDYARLVANLNSRRHFRPGNVSDSHNRDKNQIFLLDFVNSYLVFLFIAVSRHNWLIGQTQRPQRIFCHLFNHTIIDVMFEVA